MKSNPMKAFMVTSVYFLIFETDSLGETATLPYMFEKISQKWTPSALCIFTKLSQNLSARYDCRLCSPRWIYCIFLIFSYIFIDNSCLKYCIFTKHSQIVYLIITHIFKDWNAICYVITSYGRLFSNFFSI